VRLSLIGLTVVLTAGSFIAAAAGASPAGASTAAISLKPSVGPPTSKVMVGGSGYRAGETVAIFFDLSRIGSAVADRAGGFDRQVVVPASARPGSHVVAAHGVVSGLLAKAAFVVRTDWLQQCFEAGRSCFNPYENVLGPRNVGRLARSWAAKIGASGAGSAVYQGGVLYAGGSGGVYGLNPSTGAIIINFRPGPVTTTPAVLPGSGRVPAEIVFGTAGGRLAGATRTGGLRWQVSLGAAVTSPLVACFPPDPCRVIVGAGHGLYAFDRDGNHLWTDVLEGGDISTGGPVVADAAAKRLAVAAGNRLYSVNAADGSVAWSVALSRQALCDPAAGNPQFVPAPRILVGDHGGTLYQVDPGTGAVVSKFTAGGAITGSPAIGDPNLTGPWVFAADSRGHVYAFANPRQFGTPAWADKLSGPVNGAPVLANGVLYIGTNPAIGNANLYALDAATGRILLRTALAGRAASAPMVADGKLVLALASGQIAGYETPDT
jgi:outer membrane protein assembly factor BamB